ncbi:MAG: HAD family hydrolase, partial [Gemmatimonadales bacterium]
MRKSTESEHAAVIWDFDGTLVDSAERNLDITRSILSTEIGVDPDEISALRTIHGYRAAILDVRSWRELYVDHFHLSRSQAERAGTCWTEYQLLHEMELSLLPGIEEVVKSVAGPQAIVSLNSASQISRTLSRAGVDDRFSAIIGYEEFPSSQHKPAPGALLFTIDSLGLELGSTVFFVGDHPVDAECVHRARASWPAEAPFKLLFVAAQYVCEGTPSDW